MTTDLFDQGERVKTPGGLGVVRYRRMAAPDYDRVAVYSVALDSAIHNPNYTGSIYPAHEVSKVQS